MKPLDQRCMPRTYWCDLGRSFTDPNQFLFLQRGLITHMLYLSSLRKLFSFSGIANQFLANFKDYELQSSLNFSHLTKKIYFIFL